MNKPKYDICNSINALHRLREDVEMEWAKSGRSREERREISNNNAKPFYARIGAQV